MRSGEFARGHMNHGSPVTVNAVVIYVCLCGMWRIGDEGGCYDS